MLYIKHLDTFLDLTSSRYIYTNVCYGLGYILDFATYYQYVKRRDVNKLVTIEKVIKDRKSVV